MRSVLLAVFASSFASPMALGQEPVTPEQQEARKREAEASEDPLQQRQSEKVDRPDLWSSEPSGVKLYGSARLRYRWAERDDAIFGDGGSRVGVDAAWQYRPQSWLFGRVEAGINLLDAVDRVFSPSSRSDGDPAELFPRLYYVALETPDLIAAFGKSWSTYYQVTAFTDQFDSTGASASGTYNAQTDGGPTGTGRANEVLQTRLTIDWLPESLHVKPFDMNVQVQYDREIPQVAGAHYGLAFDASAVFKTKNDTEVGLAYNYAQVRDKHAPAVVAAGIQGDAQALAIAARRISDRWYLAGTVARLRNHETTNEGRYVDFWGWEAYGRYRLFGKLWAVGGWNWLRPDGSQPLAGRYQVKYGVLGLRYSIKEFRRLLYFEARIDQSRNVDGTPVGNSAALGIRWDFD